MKTIQLLPILLSVILFSLLSESVQGQQKRKLCVLNVDSKGMTMNSEQMGNLLRIEVERLDTFEVMDRYDVNYLIQKHDLKVDNCFGKICLVETGRTLESQLMLSGTVELFGQTIILTLRMIDVNSGTTIKTNSCEYLNLQNDIQMMIRLSLKRMLGMAYDKDEFAKLTKPFNFENTTNNPNRSKINLSGPRMGAIAFSGESANRMRESKNTGGYDVYPVMFQFGYQFEVQYLNQGNFQALFELIPTITGLDQSLLIPSFTLMNGLRNTVNGWEFAFGPTFNLGRKAHGYYDGNHVWHLLDGATPAPDNVDDIQREDSRGDYTLGTGFVIAVGKTFKSGKLNIPVNAFVIPAKDGFRFGISFGYNAKNHDELQAK